MLARAGEVEERLGHLGHLLTYRPRYALEEVLNLVGVQSVCDVDLSVYEHRLGARCMVSRHTISFTCGKDVMVSRKRRSSSGGTASPSKSARESLPSSQATKTSTAPIPMEAIPSKTCSPVIWVSRSPAVAISIPVSAAMSS